MFTKQFSRITRGFLKILVTLNRGLAASPLPNNPRLCNSLNFSRGFGKSAEKAFVSLEKRHASVIQFAAISLMSKMKMADGSTILRRNRPGTKAKDFCRWPEEPFEEMDSTLAVQQYIQQLIRNNPANIDLILKMPESQDEGVWKYEHLRQFCMELNGLAVRLQGECHPETCTQMTATEQWIFLCAAHKTPKECPAIDYTRHTLDGAACLLNSNKYFPSRVSIKESSVAKLGSVCRRVYRIFSHAYFHHRSIFDEFENETCLCKRFTQFVTKYNLMSKDNLIVPILEDESAPGESEA